MVVWFYLLPIGVIDENIAANLFTSALFMVFTIVFLSWLLNLREKRDWNIVKYAVNTRIQTEMIMISDFILSYTKNGYEIKLEILALKDKSSRDERYLKAVEEMYNEPEIEFDKVFIAKLFEESTLTEIKEYIDRLNSIENRYFRFLTPELAVVLMNIEDCLESIQLSIQSQLKIEKLEKHGLSIRSTSMSLRQGNTDILSATFKRILENILLIQEQGIAIEFA